jgi:hypothetical protein
MTPALPVVLSLALGATLSTSKFGFVAIGPGTGLSTVLTACPRAVQTAQQLVGASAEAVLASYRSQCAGGVELLELPAASLLPLQFTAAQGQADADAYWGSVQSLAFGSATPPSLVTETSLRWIAGPANLFQLVDPNGFGGQAAYLSGFVGQLATRVKQRAAVAGATYSLVVPPWSHSTPGAFCDVVAAARTADAGVAWSWSAITNLPTPVTDEATTTFGYRTVRTTCVLGDMPLFVQLTAAGGWFVNGRTGTQIVDWMKSMDAAVAADTDIVTGGAVLLRSLGGGGIDDLGPASTELATFLQTPSQSGGGGGGGGTTGSGTSKPPPEGTNPTPLLGTNGHQGCGNPAGAASLLALAPLALRLRRRRRR